MIRNYTAIARSVQAVQFDGSDENIQEVIELTGHWFLDGVIRASIGEWIIKKDDDEFEVLTNEEFQLNYR